jgi:predicted component of type VI protein secretion system
MAICGRLVIQREVEQPAEVILDKEAVSLGRGADNDVVLADARVSRHHARLTHVHGRFVLTDLQSANGMWIDGKNIADSTPAMHQQALSVDRPLMTIGRDPSCDLVPRTSAHRSRGRS